MNESGVLIAAFKQISHFEVVLVNCNELVLFRHATATLFLEFWKRHRASYVCEWKVSDWCEEEVPSLFARASVAAPSALDNVSVLTDVGGADPGDRQQRQLRAQTVQALLPAQHAGADLRHRHGGWRPHSLLGVFFWPVRLVSRVTGEDNRAPLFLTDTGHHWADPSPGGVQGDRRGALGRRIVGVP